MILYVHDVDKLSAFYREPFGFVPVEEIAGEWTVLRAGAVELALHRVGAAYGASGPLCDGRDPENIFLQMEVGSTLYADHRSPLDRAQLCVAQQELVNRR